MVAGGFILLIGIGLTLVGLHLRHDALESHVNFMGESVTVINPGELHISTCMAILGISLSSSGALMMSFELCSNLPTGFESSNGWHR